MRKLFLLILVFICSVAFGQGEVLKAHYPWEYNEPSDWANIHYVKSGEALLLVNDSADRYIAFDCIVQSSGQYSVDVYGGIRADSLIYTQTLNTTVDFNYQMPQGKGKSYGLNGYDTYIIRIYPTLKTKQITNFTLRQHPSSTMADVEILLANINIPSLTSFRFDSPGAGAGGNAICMKYCNVYNCSNITTLENAFYQCTSLYTVTLPKELNNVTYLVAAFSSCTSLHHVKFPKIMDNVTTVGSSSYYAYSCFAGCTSLLYVEMPQSMAKVTDFSYVFANCSKLQYLYMPKYAPLITSMLSLFGGCNSIKHIRMPMIMNNVTTAHALCHNCYELEDIDMPISMNSVTTLESAFYQCYKLKQLSLPDTLNSVTTINEMCRNTISLTNITMPRSMTSLVTLTNNTGLLELDSISTCTFGTGMANVQFTFRDLKTFKQPTLKVSKFICTGQSLAVKSSIHTIDIDWTNSTYGGTTPQIDIRWNNLSATTIDAIFTALPVVVGKTIDVSGNPGSATCTPAIASLKGWTVIIL